MRVRAKRKRRRGFTIIEVMLALALFGVAVTTFTVAYLNIINAIAAIHGMDTGARSDLQLLFGHVRRCAHYCGIGSEMPKKDNCTT